MEVPDKGPDNRGSILCVCTAQGLNESRKGQSLPLCPKPTGIVSFIRCQVKNLLFCVYEIILEV